ncbi:hypothetical protein LEMLEM_LOCUS5403, partial [Lemmus lemmus]
RIPSGRIWPELKEVVVEPRCSETYSQITVVGFNS